MLYNFSYLTGFRGFRNQNLGQAYRVSRYHPIV